MPRIAITCGDPAGIGPEIAAKWIQSQELIPPTDLVLIGFDHWIRQNLPDNRCDFESVGDPEFVPKPGSPDREGARVAMLALEAAAGGADAGRFDAVVTGPVSKKWMQQIGFYFPGQTEFFADRWEGTPTMAFAGGRMRVALATWHLPLREVPEAVTPAILERTIRDGARLCRVVGVKHPRIAVCGLNPHAGESGLLGTEEFDRLNPLLADLRPEIPGLSECLPADTVFHRHLEGEFDLVVALYHDQGLGPLKAVDFDRAANLTLGLRHVRTSPDHGTAYSLAGTGTASVGSFAAAVEMACMLAADRADG